MNKLEKLKIAAGKVSGEKADLTANQQSEKKIKRTEKLSCYLTPDEKEKFLSKIGRQRESEALRKLVYEFIGD